MSSRPKSPHHHGNLRVALVDAGLAILLEEGLGGLTLRRAAARAGVSHAAPAHHFDGLSGLMTAIATRAYGMFADRLAAGRDLPAKGDEERLLNICLAYLDFSRDHAGLFDLMFVSPGPDRDDPTLKAAGAEAYQILREGCRPFAADGTADPVVEIAVWTMVHGYALLGLSSPESPKRQIVEIPPFAALLRRLLSRRDHSKTDG
ncbi:TetR/AcrR family transcriptional regulator [Frigidibacter sp. RF13]|uniref:TetR/AcrR family transcriptional regulator n=1 Tax=Frigidibacter sp. RF13 TaxID=2997340 RepID=UPI002270476C|nr:TetR/AcrR family transcriptional regulator [Frigidibacter sp. RF13]MCY1126131.1 TetR/AcrR family transcriptional regulator [Frigidibacter sp. RF13]